jgi:biopolymer transport protein ExbB/TolQ
VAIALRGAWLLRPGAIRTVARQLPANDSAERSEAGYRAALQLYGQLQPLIAMYILSPLIGLLGSLSALIPLQEQLLSPGARQMDLLTTAYQQALIPPFWGVAIAAFSYTAFAMLRARIFHIETELLQ